VRFISYVSVSRIDGELYQTGGGAGWEGVAWLAVAGLLGCPVFIGKGIHKTPFEPKTGALSVISEKGDHKNLGSPKR